MAWGFSKGKKGEETEPDAINPPIDVEKTTKDALKLQRLLETLNEKFDEKYKDLSLATTIPALLQLIAQLKKKKSGDDTFQRDLMYENAGSALNKADLKGLDQELKYADWAYEKTEDIQENLKQTGFILLRHEPNKEAGKVGYYISYNPEKKVALIGVKGTDSKEDMLTDCCAATATHELERNFVEGDKGWFEKLVRPDKSSLKNIHCHEGILVSSKWLAEELKPFVRDFFVPLEYQILVCGHSLGAGSAGLVATILRSQIPELIETNSIQVKAFASPPILNREAAMASSSFITTIVNNTDMVPRCSLNNVEVLFEVLQQVQTKLKEGGIDCNDFKSTMAFIEKIQQGTEGDSIMTLEEAFECLAKAQEAVPLDDPNHLYVGGKVILLFEKYQDHQKRKELNASNDKKSKKDSSSKDEERLPTYCVQTDPVTSTLRAIEIHKDMIFDHLTDSYAERIDDMLN